MQNDSLKKRYLSKLIANVISLLLNVIIQAIIPRGLGPRNYGNFQFLTNFFQQVIGFLDMGTSIGFFTKLSKRSLESSLVIFYVYFSGAISTIVFILVLIAQITHIDKKLWPDQNLQFVYLAALWSILTWFNQIIQAIADACGETVNAEIIRIAQRFFALFLILVLFFSDQLSLTHFFGYHFIILLFSIFGIYWVLGKNGIEFFRTWTLKKSQITIYIREFYKYSHPLFFFACISLIIGILDRWFLQQFSGSIEQGFYGLSYQIGAVCFLFSSAMTPLITREFSRSFEQKNIDEMARLFRRYIPMLFSITAYIACFVAVHAEHVTVLFGGQEFKLGTYAVMIMAFYPIHQTYGQLSSAIFFATDNTKLYRNIGSLFMLLGLPITLVLIAPSTIYGLNLGATGLAAKMVLIQLLSVNVQLYFNAKFLKLPFIKYFLHQFGVIGIFVSIAYISELGVTSINKGSSIFFRFMTGGFLYTILVVCTVAFLPAIFGLRRRDLQQIKHLILLNLKRS
jgi:O-antigen/teichoic acid export membrane protein